MLMRERGREGEREREREREGGVTVDRADATVSGWVRVPPALRQRVALGQRVCDLDRGDRVAVFLLARVPPNSVGITVDVLARAVDSGAATMLPGGAVGSVAPVARRDPGAAEVATVGPWGGAWVILRELLQLLFI